MKHITRGLISGLLAGLIMGIIYFIDYGPGNGLRSVAGWFNLAGSDGRLTGFVLLLALGALLGLIFGAIQRGPFISAGHAISMGLLFGAAEWAIFAFIVPVLLGHVLLARYRFGDFLYPFMLCLLFGLLLGTIYFQGLFGVSARTQS